jgi:hypothetical protein
VIQLYLALKHRIDLSVEVDKCIVSSSLKSGQCVHGLTWRLSWAKYINIGGD